jgi:quinol monooxygenase YgiN
MIIVQGWIRVAPSAIEAVRHAMVTMVEATRREPGCLDYAFSIDLIDPHVVRISETWVDQAALDAHFASPHMAAFNATLAGTRPQAGEVLAYQATFDRTLIRLPPA